MRQQVSFAVVDEHPLLAEGVVQVLRQVGRFELVGVGAGIDDAVRIAREKQPELMILEVTLSGGDGGIAAATQIAEISPLTRTVFLTNSEVDEHVSAALRTGAKGYILKGVEKSEFVRIINDVLGGKVYVNPGLAARLLGRARSGSGTAGGDAITCDLTAREREIISHVALGKTNKEVAAVLSLGEKTVKHHMTSIMQKLQVRNRVEAVLIIKEKFAAILAKSGAAEPAGPGGATDGAARRETAARLYVAAESGVVRRR